MVKEIRGNAGAVTDYSAAFDAALVVCTAKALGVVHVRAALKVGALYPLEMQVKAALAGFIEEFKPQEAALLFQVASALAFERNNSRLSRFFSTVKRSQYEDHEKIMNAAERVKGSLLRGPVLERFISRFALK